MQTVLFVSTMTLGKETDVRELHDQFPVEALESGETFDNMAAYIGSGFYALQLGFHSGDFQERFREFVTNPALQSFFDQLREFIDELPAPSDHTAELHLAVPLFAWQRTAPAAG